MQTSKDTPKAFFFDVFGTLVDWRTSIARESEAILKPPRQSGNSVGVTFTAASRAGKRGDASEAGARAGWRSGNGRTRSSPSR